MEQSEHTQDLLSSPSYVDVVCGAPNTMTIITSKDHQSQITITDIIIVEKYEYCKDYQM